MAVEMEQKIDILKIDKMDDFTISELKQMVLRISSFMEKVADGEKWYKGVCVLIPVAGVVSPPKKPNKNIKNNKKQNKNKKIILESRH